MDHHPELVAEHFTEARLADKAVEFWLRSGYSAVARGANHEAIIHLKRGLSLVGDVSPDERVRQDVELQLQMGLMPALIASEGWVSAELGHVYQRAQALVDFLGDTPHRFRVLGGTFGYHFVAGRVAQSMGLAKQNLRLASEIGDPRISNPCDPRSLEYLLTIAHQQCSAAYCYHGNFAEAVQHAEDGLRLLNLERERHFGRTFSLSSCVGMRAYKYIAEWMLGRPKQAAETNDLCVTLAEDIGHPPSVGFALTARTGWCYLEGDAEETLKSAEAALDVAREERLGFWEPMISVFRWWAASERGERAEGVARIRDALERYRKKGNGVQQVWMNVILADAQWKAGQCDDAFITLAETMRLASENGEGLFEPELYRLEGEFRFQQATGTPDLSKAASSDDRMTGLAHAERCIREALNRARRQEARMLELRSLVSLCRVQKELGTVPPEYEALAETYNAFTDGFDTPDLREARRMLETFDVK